MAKPRFHNKAPTGGAGAHLLRTAVKTVVALALGFGLLAGIAWLGSRAGREVTPQTRYTVAFADIEPSVLPPGIDRKTFLTEVRYQSELPDTVQSVDPNLDALLKLAFAKHPWVKAVERIAILPAGGIRVDLTIREPALKILLGRGSDARVLDRAGVLLPGAAGAGGLPVLVNRLVPQNVPAGTVWPDPDVLRAIELVVLYPCEKIERVLEGWQLTLKAGRIQRIATP